jgi:phosphatidylserine/phosphatidylglycerophosphate/cardiolipin synthase-like enzyme
VAGATARIMGRQVGDTLESARLAPVSETAEAEAAPDQALVAILAIAENPPPAILAMKKDPRVVAMRPGYRFTGPNVEPALVILTVGPVTAEELGAPASIGDTPVTVQPADPDEQLLGFAGVIAYWKKLLSEGAEAEAAPAIAYVPPADVELEECKVHNILCHVGPDSGWETLEPFLDGTEESLTVSMFDFYAEQIIKTMVALGKNSDRKLELVLQEDKADESNAVAKLKKAWKDRLQYTKASVSGPNRQFNNSVHTKLAVRDGKSFWLSSGNWTPTSQPVIADGQQPTIYNRGNREWHVIIDDEKLAQIFEKFIQYDFKNASETPEPETVEQEPDLLVPESFFFEEEAAVVQPAPFDAQEFATSGAAVRVKPLMTPDNYPDAILNLIESAKTSLWMQYSYIRAPRDNDKYRKLVKAVAARMKAGVDVRVIIGGTNQKAADTQALFGLGWKPEMVRLQRSKVHNKGILVDSKIAVVGSQNWSQDGTQYNRDASLILYSAPIAKYFGKVFQFDWDNLTRPAAGAPEFAPVIAPPGEATPPGMVRIPWSRFYTES